MSKKNQKGAIFIFAGTLLILVLSFAALAVELSRLFVIRNELQNAADAAVLAGAGKLYPVDSSGNPNWSAASSKAQAIVILNKAEGTLLQDGSVTTGYWDMTGTTKGIIAPPLPSGLQPNFVAALKINVSKSAGHNGGPVSLYFGKILNIKTSNVSATAVAFIGFPYAIPAHTLFPIAMSQAIYNSYWDSSKGVPKINPSTGKPYVFNIESSGSNGNWTSFDTNANDVGTIQGLITNGNATPLSIGSNIWIQPGVKTSIYSSVPTNIDVVVPVVNNASVSGTQAIIGFGSIHIISAAGGSTKAVTVQFNYNYKLPEATLGGPNYGVYVPPRLAGQ